MSYRDELIEIVSKVGIEGADAEQLVHEILIVMEPVSINAYAFLLSKATGRLSDIDAQKAHKLAQSYDIYGKWKATYPHKQTP